MKSHHVNFNDGSFVVVVADSLLEAAVVATAEQYTRQGSLVITSVTSNGEVLLDMCCQVTISLYEVTSGWATLAQFVLAAIAVGLIVACLCWLLCLWFTIHIN